MNESNPALLRFLLELRQRILNCLIILFIVFGCLIYFANNIYSWLAHPLLKHLPPGHGLIATNIIAPLFAPFELTFIVSLFLAVPVFLYQLWAFVAPALYKHEKRYVWILLLMSTLLFYIGVSFAYFIIFPLIFKFLIQTAPHGVYVSPDISQYLDFTLRLFFIFGAIFEVPVAVTLLVWSGVVTRDYLVKMRPYAIVGAFIIGMLLGPPDILSQILFAVPLWLLFEVGLLVSRFFSSKI